MKGKGILEVVGTSVYDGPPDVGNPFDVLSKLPNSDSENQPGNESGENDLEVGDNLKAGGVQGAEPPKEADTERQPRQQQPDYTPAEILSELFKEQGYDIGEVDKKSGIKDVLDKLQEKYVGTLDPKKLGEEHAREKGWTDENMETQRLFSAGKMSWPEQENYNKLSNYANFKLDLSEEASDGEREMNVKKGKEVISHMLEKRLSGVTLARNIAGLDEYSDDFPAQVEEAVQFAAAEKEAIRENKIRELDEEEREENEEINRTKEVIKKGDFFGEKMTQAEIDSYMDKIYNKTETVKFKDGSTEKLSKYEKNILEIKHDPIKAARIMAIIADGVDLEKPILIGKNKMAEDLGGNLTGAILRAQQKNKQKQFQPDNGKPKYRGEIVDSKTY